MKRWHCLVLNSRLFWVIVNPVIVTSQGMRWLMCASEFLVIFRQPNDINFTKSIVRSEFSWIRIKGNQFRLFGGINLNFPENGFCFRRYVSLCCGVPQTRCVKFRFSQWEQLCSSDVIWSPFATIIGRQNIQSIDVVTQSNDSISTGSCVTAKFQQINEQLYVYHWSINKSPTNLRF